MWDNTENPSRHEEFTEQMNPVDWAIVLVTASISGSAFIWAAWQTIEAVL